jgi:hypothetical protein
MVAAPGSPALGAPPPRPRQAKLQRGDSRDRVRWRHQLGPCRTSSWSRPVSPFASLQHGFARERRKPASSRMPIPSGSPKVSHPKACRRSRAASTSQSTRESSRCLRSGVASPAASTICQPFSRSTGASRPRRCSAACWGIPAGRTGRRSARSRRGRPRPSVPGRLAWSAHPSRGHPSCRDGRPLASTVATLAHGVQPGRPSQVPEGDSRDCR